MASILPSVAIPVGMLVALMVTAFGAGIHVPGDAGRVDPTRLAEKPPFNEPGMVALIPGRYEARIVAGIWLFTPNEVRVPGGATVTFVATSRDVIHGFSLLDVNVNLMLLPGRVARATATFERPGEHVLHCHAYCGIAHHTMFGKVIAEDCRCGLAGGRSHEKHQRRDQSFCRRRPLDRRLAVAARDGSCRSQSCSGTIPRWWPWLAVAGLLILLAYGPIVAYVVSTSPLNAPGYRVW